MTDLFSIIINNLKSYNYKHFNIRLLLWVCMLTVLGILVISSATDSNLYEKKQIIGFIMGMILLITAALFNYKFILRFYWIFYFINLTLLLLVKIIGSNHLGAQRWIDLGPIQIQPSEFTKLFLILFFAAFLEKYQDILSEWKIILYICALFFVPLLLVLSQPDLSTSIVIGCMFASMYFIAGLNYKRIALFLGVFAVFLVVFLYLIMQPNQKLLKPYQLKRLTAFTHSDDPEYNDDNLQQDNSIMAIGSGGLWGKGLNNDTSTSVKNANYILEPQTDFIFTIVGEELGFIGTMSVIILLLLIVIECFYVAANAPDLSGKLIAVGFGFLVAMQSFVNIAVVTKIMPNTGLPLPFVSYGLSSLLSMFSCVGIVLNISLQRRDAY
ncbi:rod shape determining protein RodA [Lachnospiraceae bacterium RM5]|nr:rod shape determining protein RodA [Lachnospiraceae bacterium RM5]